MTSIQPPTGGASHNIAMANQTEIEEVPNTPEDAQPCSSSHKRPQRQTDATVAKRTRRPVDGGTARQSLAHRLMGAAAEGIRGAQETLNEAAEPEQHKEPQGDAAAAEPERRAEPLIDAAAEEAENVIFKAITRGWPASLDEILNMPEGEEKLQELQKLFQWFIGLFQDPEHRLAKSTRALIECMFNRQYSSTGQKRLAMFFVATRARDSEKQARMEKRTNEELEKLRKEHRLAQDALKADLQNVRNQLKASQEAQAKSEQNLTGVANERDAVKKDLAKSEQNLVSITNELKASQEAQAKAEADLAKVANELKASQEVQAKVQADLAKAQADLASIRNEVNTLNQQGEAVRRHRDALLKEAGAAGAAAGQGAALDALRRELAAAQQSLANMTNERNTARLDLAAARQSLTNMTNERDTARQSLATVTNERDAARRDLAAAQQSLATVTNERNTARQDLAAARQQQPNQQQLEALQKERDTLLSERNKLQTDLTVAMSNKNAGSGVTVNINGKKPKKGAPENKHFDFTLKKWKEEFQGMVDRNLEQQVDNYNGVPLSTVRDAVTALNVKDGHNADETMCVGEIYKRFTGNQADVADVLRWLWGARQKQLKALQGR